MNDQTKLLVHFLVSKLVILAVPILNGLLALVGITVTTSTSTTDNIANYLCIAIGLAYSEWTRRQAKAVHTNVGFAQGVNAAMDANGKSPIPTSTEVQSTTTPTTEKTNP